ncbi:MAG: single-stranded-DNA-specific exonuclease RecJ [Sphingobacteriaceae bacterium]|nr:single-stranded-DNA-specific exonuclease RecJ [Sphingobacteriaceae bacterium]
MEKRWNIPDLKKGAQDISKIQEILKVDRVIASLLYQRNLKEYEEIKTFFRPELTQLHDPFIMKGMSVAIDRIDKAIANKEKILIYGDYDVDGTTAVSVVYRFFKTHTDQIAYYIPDRYAEGYGISFKGIDFAKENGFSLIIALDCGIKAIDKIDYANERKVDFIICDHHLPGEAIPKAIAVLDPKQHDCSYPYKELSGAGIGFKLIEAYSRKNNLDLQLCYNFLDLVVTSIAADIVPITGENRVLAHFGLEKMNTNPRPGLKALLNMNQLAREITITNLVFVLSPRINAAGRIKQGSAAVELLVCENEDEANELAKGINDTNTQRKDLDLGTTTEAFALLENDPITEFRKTTVLFSDKWHKGVVGIVASRLIEKYYKPTIVLTESDGKATGSARSVRDYDIYSAIEKCSDLLEQFGGHKFAAGLTMKKENVGDFITRFEDVVSRSISDDQLIPQLQIETELEFHEITQKLVRILKQFAPHGPENMMPVFVSKNVFDNGWAKIVGANHLKLELFQKSNPNIRFSAIAYDKGDYVKFFHDKTPMSIAYKIQENEFNGKTSIQLVIEDFKVS